jgi:hypothetical protein
MKIWHVAFLALALTVACADDDPIEQINEDITCEAICDRYQDCFVASYDVDDCKDRCLERADDPNHEDEENVCESCIDGASCTQAAFTCINECAGIVP